jgi:hypothetical protein
VTDIEEDEERKPPSAQFEHCCMVFKEMWDQGTEEDINSSDGKPVTKLRVYEGHLTKLFAGLGKATPYYTTVMTALKQMGCVEQLRRGGGSASSRWILRYEPTLEMFESYEARKRGGRGKYAMLEQHLNALTARVADLESAHERMATVIDAQERTIKKLNAFG